MNGGEGNGGRSSEDITLTATSGRGVVARLATWVIGEREDQERRER